MIDYVEGLIEARKTLQQIDSACLQHDYESAIDMCEHLIVVTRLLRNQIMIQSESK